MTSCFNQKLQPMIPITQAMLKARRWSLAWLCLDGPTALVIGQRIGLAL